MKRRQSSAHRNVHSTYARNQSAVAYARSMPQPEPLTLDMDAFIAGIQFASDESIREIRRVLEAAERSFSTQYFVRKALEDIQTAHLRYSEEQRQAEQAAAAQDAA